jgi:hypothetical protein
MTLNYGRKKVWRQILHVQGFVTFNYGRKKVWRQILHVQGFVAPDMAFGINENTLCRYGLKTGKRLGRELWTKSKLPTDN